MALSDTDRGRLWAGRLGAFSVRELELVAGLTARVARRILADMAAEGFAKRTGRDRWTAGIVEMEIEPRQPRIRDVVARTLDWTEGMLTATPLGGVPAIRRYALRSLGSLVRNSGLIDRLQDVPYPASSAWHAHIMNNVPIEPELLAWIQGRAERIRPWQDRYRERTRAIQLAWVEHGPKTDPVALFYRLPAPDPTWPVLPPQPEQLMEGAARRALEARLGMNGQMLAFSKSRAPWATRCVWNGQVIIGGRDVWKGDLWFLPPEAPATKGGDARLGAVELARHFGLPVEVTNEPGTVLWVAAPDGSLTLTDRGHQAVVFRGELLEKDGWPGYGEFTSYPVEHRVGRPLPSTTPDSRPGLAPLGAAPPVDQT